MSERTVGLAEIAGAFLKIGAMSYGGPAIMGIMQTEVQEKRQRIEKQQFVEGFALVNILPDPGATQLGIFLGHAGNGTGFRTQLLFFLDDLIPSVFANPLLSNKPDRSQIAW